MLYLHVNTWSDSDALKKIQESRLNYNDSPLEIPSRSMMSLKRRFNILAQFQNVINCFSSMV